MTDYIDTPEGQAALEQAERDYIEEQRAEEDASPVPPVGAEPGEGKRRSMDRNLLQRASRMFNSVADLRTDEDRRINEWFKQQLADAALCCRCRQPRDSEQHYIGTVDSHEFDEGVARLAPSPEDDK